MFKYKSIGVNMKNLFDKRILIIFALIAVAIITRFLPHPPNFSPILAIALFGSVYFTDKRLAFVIPISIMFLSDIFLGFHSDIPAVYLSFLLVVVIGRFIKNQLNAVKILGVSIISSILFYLITNFSVWLTSGMYPPTWSGLFDCYIMALPFFRNAIFGDLIFNSVLFGGFYLIEKYYISIEIHPKLNQ